MNLWSRILRRPFAMARPKSSSKNFKAELNFKEINETADPYDVIDRNVSGIEHRLRLRELRRLKDQLFLDKPDLNSFKKDNLPFDSNYINSGNYDFELSYSTLSLFPGINCATEFSLDPSVTICVKFESSKFSKLEIKNIKKLMNLGDEAKECRFTISDFPLVSQNKTRAIHVLKAIVDVAKNEKIVEKDLDSLIHYQNTVYNSKRTASDDKHLEFPEDWLQGIHKKENIN